jgi:hypothetical protein
MQNRLMTTFSGYDSTEGDRGYDWLVLEEGRLVGSCERDN